MKHDVKSFCAEKPKLFIPNSTLQLVQNFILLIINKKKSENGFKVSLNGSFFFNSSITRFNKKFTVTGDYIFWCVWESTNKKMLKSQLDIGILILKIIQM